MRRIIARAWNLALEALLLIILIGVMVFTLAPYRRVGETPGMANQKPTLGRIVLYAFLNGSEIVERPAEVVSIHGDLVNLHVNLDGTNDLHLAGVTAEDCKRMVLWGISVAAADNHETAQAGRWRWPPRE